MNTALWFASGSTPSVSTHPQAPLLPIHGGLFSVKGKVPYGPRPDHPDNIIDWAAYVDGDYDGDPHAEAVCFETWQRLKFTHAAVGPFIDPGYHGQFPPSDFRQGDHASAVAAKIHRMRDRGLRISGFLSPDNWTLEQVQGLDYIWSRPEWQSAFDVVVPMGYEPSKDTPNSVYVEWFKWARARFPAAKVAWHSPSDFDAPGNNDDLTPNQPNYIGIPACWHHVAPYLHYFYGQYGPYYDWPENMPDTKREFQKLFEAGRFKPGNHYGWPSYSADGPNVPIKWIAFEQCCFPTWWNNIDERIALAWGDVALDAGADGIFDGANF